MALVKIKDRYQITLPASMRRHAQLAVGDVMEAIEQPDGEIRLRPKRLVDRAIAEGLDDLRAGRVHGPFESVEEMLASMQKPRNKKSRR